VNAYFKDLAERVAWTAAQAGLGVITVESLHVPTPYAALVAAVLAGVKGFVAKKVNGTPGLPYTPKH